MNLTVSQWLQIAAIAISAAISLSRWVWDVRKDKRNIQAVQKTSEALEIPARRRTPKGSRAAFFLPLAVLLWQTIHPGELTRFDFGIMIFSAIVFIGFMLLQVTHAVSLVLECQAFETGILGKMVEGQTAYIALLKRTTEPARPNANNLPGEDEEIEQDGGEQPATRS